MIQPVSPRRRGASQRSLLTRNVGPWQPTAITVAVENFYRLALADPALRTYFLDNGLPRHCRDLAAALVASLNAPCPQSRIAFATALPLAALKPEDCDLVGHYLLTALLQQHLGPDLLTTAAVLLNQARRQPARSSAIPSGIKARPSPPGSRSVL